MPDQLFGNNPTILEWAMSRASMRRVALEELLERDTLVRADEGNPAFTSTGPS